MKFLESTYCIQVSDWIYLQLLHSVGVKHVCSCRGIKSMRALSAYHRRNRQLIFHQLWLNLILSYSLCRKKQAWDINNNIVWHRLVSPVPSSLSSCEIFNLRDTFLHTQKTKNSYTWQTSNKPCHWLKLLFRFKKQSIVLIIQSIHFENWFHNFPSWASLTHMSRRDIEQIWEWLMCPFVFWVERRVCLHAQSVTLFTYRPALPPLC